LQIRYKFLTVKRNRDEVPANNSSQGSNNCIVYCSSVCIADSEYLSQGCLSEVARDKPENVSDMPVVSSGHLFVPHCRDVSFFKR